jgi:hypothetical protein
MYAQPSWGRPHVVESCKRDGRQLEVPVVLPHSEMLPKNLACFCPKSGVDRGENLSPVKTILQDTGLGW